MTASEITIDARGLRCPLPVIRLAAAARDSSAGQTLNVLTTDPAARHDVPAWARMRGHEVLGGTEEPVSSSNGTTTWSITVRIGK